MAFDPYASSASKKGNGSRFMTFNWADKKVEFYKIKEAGDYSVDIIPYKIATKKHPLVKEGAQIGDEVYYLDFWVHKNVGPRQATVVCPASTLGHKCPICEAQEAASREYGAKSKEAGDLKAKHRVMYNVVDPDDGDEKIKVFEESFALFEQPLIEVAGAKGRRKGKDFIRFANIEEGWTVSFSATQESFNGSKYFKYAAFDLDQRDKPHDKSLVKKALSLDEYLMVKSYDELLELMTGESEASDEDEDETPPKQESKPSDEDNPTCPAGKKFGKDYDRDADECDDCEYFRECRRMTRESKE